MEGSTEAFCDQLETHSPNTHSVQQETRRFTCRSRNEDHSNRDDPTETNKEPVLSTPGPNRSCIICFFQMLLREFNGLALEEMIPVCMNCKQKIAHFYLHKRHETLTTEDTKGHDKDKNMVNDDREKRRRRRRRRANRKDIWRRYRDGDPTVGPLGQPSGKFDYLVNYSCCMKEPIGNPADPTSYKELFVPTGWGEEESSQNSKFWPRKDIVLVLYDTASFLHREGTVAVKAAAGGRFDPVCGLINRCFFLTHLQQIHAHLITHSLLSHTALHSLIRSAADAGHLTYATCLVEHFRPASPIPWNIVIQAHSKSPISRAPLRLFRLMLAVDDVSPDKCTFTFALTYGLREPSSASGEAVHAVAVKTSFVSDLYVANSLVNLYSEFRKMGCSRKLFDEMPLRDAVSWTNLMKGYVKQEQLTIAQELFDEMPLRNEVSWVVIIAGYVKVGRYHDAIELFNSMLQSSSNRPNEAALVLALSACTHIGAVSQGRWIHAYIDKHKFTMTINITNALIDMYCKCGILHSAREVFSRAPARDLLTWSTLISGLALHGRGHDALKVFDQMLSSGFFPDSIAVLGILNGCSHAGLVEEGCSIFHNMSQTWGITPEIEHYGCLIDLLGRAGQLQKALAIIIKMPLEPDIIMWRSLLSACRNHRNVELGERILHQIALLDLKKQGGGHLLVSNMYATFGRWDKMAQLRSRAREESEMKKPGWSCIEVDGDVHEFVADDRLHPRITEIRHKLDDVLREASMKGGYVANTGQVLFDLSEEDRVQAVQWHSEKLAVAFGLMSMDVGCSIRIVKSLRICEDCHSAMKAISGVFEKEIVVRDRSRFHTFREGKCSCMDYW